MNRDYIYIGMLVTYDNNDCIVISKQKDTCCLLNVKDRIKIDSISYSILEPLHGGSGDIQNYNRMMRKVGSKITSKFSMNDDKDYTFNDGSKVWFTSDTHFFHDNIMTFCKRPFVDTNEMNERMIKNWNDKISPDDTVFHLGDFAWGGADKWSSVLSRLNGHIHLILGNHDIKNFKSSNIDYFESISTQKQITVEGRKIYLNHYPMLTWGGIYRKPDDIVWQLFGHVHSKGSMSGADSTRLNYLLPYQYDVGVDNNDYTPINFKDVEKIILGQSQEVNKVL